MPFPFFGDEKSTVARLLRTLPQVGHLEWIGRRPARCQPLESLLAAALLTDAPLVGDHARPRPGGKHRRRRRFTSSRGLRRVGFPTH